jgi:hypothetical protein
MDRRRKWTDIVLPSVVLIVLTVQMTKGASEWSAASGIQPTGRSARRSIATSATCTPASFKVRGINPSKPTITAALPDATSGCNVAE